MPFSRPTLPELIERFIADIDSRLPATDARLRRSNLGVLARTHSGVAHGLYGLLDWLSRQLLPDTSEAEILDRQASIWGVARKPAAKANGAVTFIGEDGSVIPQGAVVQRSDGIEFSVDDEVTVADGVVSVAVTAVVGGAAGNTEAPSRLTLISPIAGINSAATVDAGGIINGVDAENDNALRSRLLDRIQQPPHGGADFDYVKWALEVPGVTRAWVYPLELGIGTVTVRFVVDDNEVSIIPDADKVNEVQDYIDRLRPVTAKVTVAAPVAVPLNITIAWLKPSTVAVRAAIRAGLIDLFRREAEPGGTILISHIREAISIAAGEHDHAVTAPAADVRYNKGYIPVLEEITWAN